MGTKMIRFFRFWVSLIISFVLLACSTPQVATPTAGGFTPLATRTVEQSRAKATMQPSSTPRPSPSVQASPTVGTCARFLSGARTVQGENPTEVRIVIDNVVNLYGVEVHLRFDPQKVQVQDADPALSGEQIALGKDFPKGRSFVALNRVNNVEGTIDFAVTLLNPALPLRGQVEVAKFSLLGKEAGETKLRFMQVLLADRGGNALPVVPEGLTLVVKP